MEKLKRLSILVLTALAFFTSSCDKDAIVEPTRPNYNLDASLDLGTTVNAKFFGKIVDEAENAISGVAIKAGNKTATTDARGIFIIENASVFEKLAYVSATKSGYFMGSRSLIPSTTATNNIRITMLTMNTIATVNSGEEKTVSLPSGAKIDFKGKFVDINGNAYSGVVNVAFKHLPALADATVDQMPGMLYAQNKDKEAGILETYGMMAVELTSSTGVELQIDPDSKAVIHMPLDASQLSSAPATIPLWHFDEIAGYWIEEGEATLVNGEYVGDVYHFSFWWYNSFNNSAQIHGTVTDQNGNVLSNTTVAIVTPNAATSGQTNSNGSFSTYVPANVAITIEVRDDCGNIITTINVGPYALNTLSNETIISTLNNSNSVYVTGLFYDCNNNLIPNGYVVLSSGSETYYQPVTNGVVNVPIIYCNTLTNISIIAYDYINLQETNALTVPVTTPITNLGNLIACNSMSEYFTISIDGGIPTVIIPPFECVEHNGNGSVGSGGLIYCHSLNFNMIDTFQIRSSTNLLGTYNWPNFNLWSDTYTPSQPATNIMFQLLSYGPVGSYIDINFSGTYLDTNTNMTRTISGSLHALRDF